MDNDPIKAYGVALEELSSVGTVASSFDRNYNLDDHAILQAAQQFSDGYKKLEKRRISKAKKLFKSSISHAMVYLHQIQEMATTKGAKSLERKINPALGDLGRLCENLRGFQTNGYDPGPILQEILNHDRRRNGESSNGTYTFLERTLPRPKK
jgi:hypothetical protein